MGHLGKLVKGKANRPEQKRTQIRVRNLERSVEDLEKEQQMLRLRKQTLKTSMIEEQKLSHFNRMKILTHWRKLLRLAKTEQLKKEIQIYQQNHDREVDAKDAILQMLDRDLDEAEEQYQMALRNHLIHVNELIDLQASRLRGLDEEFQRDIDIVKSEFDTEKAEIAASHEMERRELRDMIDTIQEEEENKLNEMKEAYDGAREETKNKNVEDLESMKHDLIKKIEDLDKEFEVSFNKYVSDTETKADGYKKLLEQNEKSSDEINKYQRQINRLKEQTAFLTLKIQ